ncbi:MAG: hypothetical protein LQ352_005251 [Teloschistes flavicans]|nr:MAG: hypothetical protein LQ352_005251 [Teloschistes flavicans]
MPRAGAWDNFLCTGGAILHNMGPLTDYSTKICQIYRSQLFTWRLTALKDDAHGPDCFRLAATEEQRRYIEEQYTTLKAVHHLLKQRILLARKLPKENNSNAVCKEFKGLMVKVDVLFDDMNWVCEYIDSVINVWE